MRQGLLNRIFRHFVDRVRFGDREADFGSALFLCVMLSLGAVINAAYLIVAVLTEEQPFTPNFYVVLVFIAICLALVLVILQKHWTFYTALFVAVAFVIEQAAEIAYDGPVTFIPNILWLAATPIVVAATRSILLVVLSSALSTFVGIWVGSRILPHLPPGAPDADTMAYIYSFVGLFGLITGTICTLMLHLLERNFAVASRDTLTGLFNRHLMERDTRYFHAAGRQNGQSFCLVYTDLDRFKQVNDLFGHAVGDRVLAEFGQRALAVSADFTASTGLPVWPYRAGGDEFIFLVTGCSQQETALAFGREIRRAASIPFDVDPGGAIDIGLSFGVVSNAVETESVSDLLRLADLAMYVDKARVGSGGEIDISQERNIELYNELRKPSRMRELSIVFQPIFSSVTLEFNKVEALARWNSSKFANVPPSEFIPVAEATGLIFAMTERIVSEVLAEVSRLENAPLDLTVAVNISPYLFVGRRLLEMCRLLDPLRQRGIRIELEVTETLPIINNRYALRILEELRARGLCLALDDVGQGNAFALPLQGGAFDIIKIDRMLVHEAAQHQGFQRAPHRGQFRPQPWSQGGGRRHREQRTSRHRPEPRLRLRPGIYAEPPRHGRRTRSVVCRRADRPKTGRLSEACLDFPGSAPHREKRTGSAPLRMHAVKHPLQICTLRRNIAFVEYHEESLGRF
ncbi:MAG: EAL domain-containing protein [Geminicoccaceae bacterium]